MLPPHRPFRDKPAPKEVIRKRAKPTKEELIASGSQQGERFSLKQPLAILGADTDTATS